MKLRAAAFPIAWGALAATHLATGACKAAPTTDVQPAATSPQASAVPAPVTSVPVGALAASSFAAADGGAPPSPLRADVAAPADKFPKESKEREPKGEAKETTAGHSLSFVVRSIEPPPPHRAVEVSAPVVDAARKKTDEHLSVDLGASHMRMLLEGAFLFPSGTELRARIDRLGYVMLLPPGTRYRVLPPGAMRTWFSEGRYDAMRPLDAVVRTLQASGTRLGVSTRTVEVQTESAKLVLELGKVQDTLDSGQLLCRVFAELADAAPQVVPCGTDEVPLRAEFHFVKGLPEVGQVTPPGGIVFEATRLVRRTDLSIATLSAPPSTAAFAPEDLAPAPSRLLLPEGELTDLQAPMDIPVAPDAPLSGLLVQNGTLQMQRVFLDGVPCAQVAPYERLTIVGLARGKYVTEVRTPLDGRTKPPTPVVVPGRLVLGSPDAGVR